MASSFQLGTNWSVLKEREQVRQIKLAEIRRAFQGGINSGKGSSVEELFDRLEAKYETKAL